MSSPDRRLLLVHAHPDDESIYTGATMARYAADGAQVTLVTCTLGELGEIIPPSLAYLAAEKEDRLGQYRIGELAAACAAAGVLATILACAFSIVHFYNTDGTYASSESLFSLSGHGVAWNWIGIVVAAVLSAVAALLLVASRTPWVRAGAAGVVTAFGIAVIFIFAGYQFTLGPVSSGSGPGGAEKLGAFGGLLLLVAGVLGFVAAARGDRAADASVPSAQG